MRRKSIASSLTERTLDVVGDLGELLMVRDGMVDVSYGSIATFRPVLPAH
jgi:hypothetical protein